MIPITKPVLGDEEVQAAGKVIKSGWVTQGLKVKEFEESFADHVGAKHACAVSSCTVALHLALLVAGVKPGDVVITVSHSFVATANAVRYCGAEPVFVDIDPETYNLAPGQLLKVLQEDCTEKEGGLYYKDVANITVSNSPLVNFINSSGVSPGRVAAIMPVHQMGIPCDLRQIIAIAKMYNLPVIEDAACAIGSEISFDSGKTMEKIGKPHGDIACFSFHPRKILTTGDGGMLTTNNPAYEKSFKLLRQHCMSVPDTVRHESQKIIFETYLQTGFNYRLTDIQAAIGIEQLKRLDVVVGKRRQLAARYNELLAEIPFLATLKQNRSWLCNWQSYPVRLREDSPVKQQEIMQFLLDKGVASRRGIMNSHQEPAYDAAKWHLPHSVSCRDQVIILPLFHEMDTAEQDFIAHTLKEAFNG